MKKIIGTLLCAAVLSFTFTACGSGIGTNRYDISKINGSVIDANSEFAFDIFKKLNSEDPCTSIFISPLSISTALTMTYNGTNSTTKEAMSKASRFKDIDIAAVNQSYNT